jgi:hypothetical protein
MIRNGHLKIPATHQTVVDPAQPGTCHFSICGIALNDGTFVHESWTLTQRLFLSILRDLVKLNDTTVGVAWTVLTCRLQSELGTDVAEKGLDAIYELMPQSTTPLPSVTSYNISFRYRPLSQEIRLLVLLPPTPKSRRIRCRLLHQSLHACAPYEALSYVWGNQGNRFDISVDECDFSVTSNLFEALKAIRHPRKSKILWVDAICIDQCNLEERTEQVKLMGAIYRQAWSVTAWLGPEAPESTVEEMSIVTDPDFFKDNSPDDDLKYIPTLVSLFNEEYFTRAWIVQELSLARSVNFQCGTHCWSHAHVMRYMTYANYRSTKWKYTGAADAIQGAVQRTKIDGRVQNMINNLKLFTLFGERDGEGTGSDASSTTQRVSVEDIIDIMRQRSCLDPRDRVFSTLNIHSYRTKPNELLVEPDYRLPIDDVFILAARNSILESQSLDILSRSESSRLKRSSTLPTWVPAWGHEGSSQKSGGHLSWIRSCKAPSVIIDSISLDVEFTNRDRLLQARGWKVDVIDRELNIAFADERSFISSILRLVMQASTDAEQYVCGTRSFWSSLLILVSFIGNGDRESLEAKCPPKSPVEAFAILKELWAKLQSNRAGWKGKHWTSELRTFLTRQGTYLVAPLELVEGDNVVAFPATSYVFLLRKTFEFHRLLGPWYAASAFIVSYSVADFLDSFYPRAERSDEFQARLASLPLSAFSIA